MGEFSLKTLQEAAEQKWPDGCEVYVGRDAGEKWYGFVRSANVYFPQVIRAVGFSRQEILALLMASLMVVLSKPNKTEKRERVTKKASKTRTRATKTTKGKKS